MSDALKPGVQEAASFRVYLQADGRYVAVASVLRVGQPNAKTVTSSPQTIAGQALAEVIQLSGFLEP